MMSTTSSSTPLGSSRGTEHRALTAEAGFSVRNLGRTVLGTIPVTSASVEVDELGHPLRIEATLDPGGIATGNPRRDRDLRKKQFLDVDRHPVMTFTGFDVRPAGGSWTVVGELTVRGVAGTVSLLLQRDPRPGAAGSATMTGDLDRRDFGIKAPPPMVGRRITLTITARPDPV